MGRRVVKIRRKDEAEGNIMEDGASGNEEPGQMAGLGGRW